MESQAQGEEKEGKKKNQQHRTKMHTVSQAHRH